MAATILISILLLVLTGLIIFYLCRQKEKGGCPGCSGGSKDCTRCRNQ